MKILPMLKIENRNIIPLGEIKAICPEFKKMKCATNEEQEQSRCEEDVNDKHVFSWQVFVEMDTKLCRNYER